MYVYDFDTNHWSTIDCTHGDAPSGRSSLVAQVYEVSVTAAYTCIVTYCKMWVSLVRHVCDFSLICLCLVDTMAKLY